jgi:cupin fold WbuC family metalloprotein
MIAIDEAFLTPLHVKASNSERKRMSHNFHLTYEDTIQRMLNVLNPGTYVRPHKHEQPDKREAFIVLEGRVAVIEFDDRGEIIQAIVLDRLNKVYGCELAPKVWHTIVCLKADSVLYEVKDGPYLVSTDKNFASWSPEEGSPESSIYLQNLIKTLSELHGIKQ